MAQALRITLMLVLLFTVVGCSGKVRRDFSGGGIESDVMILQDPPAVELSIWEGAILFDLRDYDEWAQGHINGARRVTVEDIQKGRALPDDKEAPVLFMGDGPMDDRPEIAAQFALEKGYTNVQLFPGGWRQWIGAHPIQDESR
jgi:rhodanese-related sulfurtransferase